MEDRRAEEYARRLCSTSSERVYLRARDGKRPMVSNEVVLHGIGLVASAEGDIQACKKFISMH